MSSAEAENCELHRFVVIEAAGDLDERGFSGLKSRLERPQGRIQGKVSGDSSTFSGILL